MPKATLKTLNKASKGLADIKELDKLPFKLLKVKPTSHPQKSKKHK